jgi:glutathione S-transferase
MKLYFHPVSTTSRPIMAYAADNGIALDYQVVDLMTGEHAQPAYTALNPSQQVPMLDDEGFRLTECSAILKYLADKVGSPAYPRELQQRARVNELMDWFNTGLSRELGYGLVYPQTLPNYRRPDPLVQAGHLAWGQEKARRWLGILDQQILGPERRFLAGPDITIADYLGAGILTLGEVIRLDYAGYPNVQRWLAGIKARPAWRQTNEVFYEHFVGAYKDTPFVGLGQV